MSATSTKAITSNLPVIISAELIPARERRATTTRCTFPTWASIRINALVGKVATYSGIEAVEVISTRINALVGKVVTYSGIQAVEVISTRLSGAPKLTITVVRAGRFCLKYWA